MTVPHSFAQAAFREAKNAGSHARPEASAPSVVAPLRMGLVKDFGESGYTVDVLDDAGNVIAHNVSRVPIVPPTAEADIDDVVWLVFSAERKTPVILASPSNNAFAYWQGYRDAGYWGAVAD